MGESGEGWTEGGCRFKTLLHGEAGDFPLKLILNAHQLVETMVSQTNWLNCLTQRHNRLQNKEQQAAGNEDR